MMPATTDPTAPQPEASGPEALAKTLPQTGVNVPQPTLPFEASADPKEAATLPKIEASAPAQPPQHGQAPRWGEELAAGDAVGEFVVEAKIGEGAFGVVYRGVHPIIAKRVAIKVLQGSGSRSQARRFLNEARAVNRIKHRNVVDIFAFGQLDDGRPYFVMELLEGETLEALLKRQGRLEWGQAMQVLRGVARALDAAHAVGVVHRDLKPANIFLLSEPDDALSPRLLDFGVAKLPETAPGDRTASGVSIGTPAYMAPEQYGGAAAADAHADVYSFGVLVHHVLTGRLPFDRPNPLDLVTAHRTEPPPPMSSVAPDLSPALDAPVLAALSKRPLQRPASATAVLDWLERAHSESGPPLAPPSSAPASTPDARRPYGALLLALFALLAALAAGAIWARPHASPAAPASRPPLPPPATAEPAAPEPPSPGPATQVGAGPAAQAPASPALPSRPGVSRSNPLRRAVRFAIPPSLENPFPE